MNIELHVRPAGPTVPNSVVDWFHVPGKTPSLPQGTFSSCLFARILMTQMKIFILPTGSDNR
jgi:hypothetical protein